MPYNTPDARSWIEVTVQMCTGCARGEACGGIHLPTFARLSTDPVAGTARIRCPADYVKNGQIDEDLLCWAYHDGCPTRGCTKHCEAEDDEQHDFAQVVAQAVTPA